MNPNDRFLVEASTLDVRKLICGEDGVAHVETFAPAGRLRWDGVRYETLCEMQRIGVEALAKITALAGPPSNPGGGNPPGGGPP